MAKHIHLIAFVAPLAAFFLLGALVPYETSDGAVQQWPYLGLVIGRVLLMGMLIVAFLRIYRQEFAFKVDTWALLVGAVGGGLWIGLCWLDLENSIFETLGLPLSWLGERDSFNPSQYDEPPAKAAFYAFRFSLLVLMVPIAEELFLRAFFMRLIDTDQWREQELAAIGWKGLVAGTLYGVLTHPSEFIAAAVWFSLITLLMKRTNRFWNCVVAHVVTNLVLGIYIVITGNWQLW